MKDAFQVLDFDDPSSEQLKVFMLQCFVTTVILKSEQVCVRECVYNLDSGEGGYGRLMC